MVQWTEADQSVSHTYKIDTIFTDNFNDKELATKMKVAEIQTKNEDLRTVKEKALLKGWIMFESVKEQMHVFKEIKTYQQQQLEELETLQDRKKTSHELKKLQKLRLRAYDDALHFHGALERIHAEIGREFRLWKCIKFMP